MSEKTRIEEILNAIINGETIEFEPKTRLEQYLKNYINKSGVEGLPDPQTRLDALLHHIVTKESGGSSGGIVEPGKTYRLKDSYTYSELEASFKELLWNDDGGDIDVAFTGPTDDPASMLITIIDFSDETTFKCALEIVSCTWKYSIIYNFETNDIGESGWYYYDYSAHETGGPEYRLLTDEEKNTYLNFTIAETNGLNSDIPIEAISSLFKV